MLKISHKLQETSQVDMTQVKIMQVLPQTSEAVDGDIREGCTLCQSYAAQLWSILNQIVNRLIAQRSATGEIDQT